MDRKVAGARAYPSCCGHLATLPATAGTRQNTLLASNRTLLPGENPLTYGSDPGSDLPQNHNLQNRGRGFFEMIRRSRDWVKRLFVDTTVELVKLREMRQKLEEQIDHTLESARLNADDEYWRRIDDDLEQGRLCGIDSGKKDP